MTTNGDMVMDTTNVKVEFLENNTGGAIVTAQYAYGSCRIR